jgi:hypothetical protein
MESSKRVKEVYTPYLAEARPPVQAFIGSQVRSLVDAALEFGVGLNALAGLLGNALREHLPGQVAAGYATPDEGLISLLSAAGGCVEVGEARLMFRKPGGVTRQALATQIRKGNVLAYRSGGGDYQVPVWQFRPEGGVLNGLPEVLAAVRDKLDDSQPLTAFAFLLQAHPLTGGRPPLEALKEGRLEAVLAAVEADAR